MYNNKRGIGIDDAVPLIIFIFVAAFGISFFKIYDNSKIDKNTYNLQIQKNVLNVHEILIQYLKEFDKNGNNNADFLSKSYIEKDYEKLKKIMEKDFSARLADFPAWHINLDGPNQKTLFYLERDGYDPKNNQIIESDPIFIPVIGQKSQYLTLRLFLDMGSQ